MEEEKDEIKIETKPDALRELCEQDRVKRAAKKLQLQEVNKKPIERLMNCVP